MKQHGKVDVDLGRAQKIFLEILIRINKGEITLAQFEQFSNLSQAQLNALSGPSLDTAPVLSYFDPAASELDPSIRQQ